MRHDIGTNNDRQRTVAARPSLLVGVVVAVTAIAFGPVAPASSASLLPPPTSSTSSTTTSTLAPRPSTTLPPRPTTPPSVVTSSTPPVTAPETTQPNPIADPPTIPIPDPPTIPIPDPPTIPIPDPPTIPPTTVVAEPFIFSDPVIVDSEDPAIQPPVIVGLTSYCLQGFGYGYVVVQNADLFHYPVPFQAVYQWTLTNASTVIEDGSFVIAGWESETINLATHDIGTYAFTVLDADLGSSASIEVVIADCTNPPAPSPDPLPPFVVVPAVSCSEDITATSGTGYFRFYVQNQPGDDASNREYDYDVLWKQASVSSGTTGAVVDATWTDVQIAFEHSGTFMLTVNDHDEPALTATVAVDVPECAPPPAQLPPALFAPEFVSVSTHCADPVLLDGRVDFVVLNPNFELLGGPGELTYDRTIMMGSSVIESFNGWFNTSGSYSSFKEPLPPGEYTATISVTADPSLTDSVTFIIADCAVDPQPPPTPVAIYGVTNVCIPGDDTETVLFVVEHHAPTVSFSWAITDGQDVLAGNVEVHLYADDDNLLSARHLPVGTHQLVVTNGDDPSITASTPVEIGVCLVDGVDDPPPSSEPDEPVDGPSTTTSPGDTSPVDPGGTTLPSVPAATTSAGTTTGSLPATGSSPTVGVVAAVLFCIAGAGLWLVSRRRDSGDDLLNPRR